MKTVKVEGSKKTIIRVFPRPRNAMPYELIIEDMIIFMHFYAFFICNCGEMVILTTISRNILTQYRGKCDNCQLKWKIIKERGLSVIADKAEFDNEAKEENQENKGGVS